MDAHVIKSQILNKSPNFSGVILISINEETVVQEVMGESNISEHIPNHMNTRFAIASGCKIFTAIAILNLVEMGKLLLDDSVTDCLANYFKSMNNSVTIRHLLTRTSGFCDYFDEEIDEDGYAKVWEDTPMYMMKSPYDFLKLLQNKEMEFEPGYRFKYNNGGFVILSMIIEKISDMNFSMFINKYLIYVG